MARRDRHPQVLAHLDVHDEAGHVGGSEEQVGPEGHPVAGDLDRLAALVVTGGEVAPLVELAVGREVGLRGDPDDRAVVDDDRAVVEPRAPLERRADDDDGPQPGGRLCDPCDGVVDRVEEGVLQQEVVDGIPRQPELGEDREGDAVVVQLTHLGDDGVGVALRVGDGDGQRAGRDAREALGVGAVEVHVHSQAHDPCDRRLAT